MFIEIYSWLFVDKDFLFKLVKRDFGFEGHQSINFRSKCECRKNQVVNLRLIDNFYRTRVISLTDIDKNTTYEIIKEYSINREQFESSIFTCSLYNTLRRGPNTKVLSYTLYGRNPHYYKDLFDLVKRAKEVYPDWVVRVHYDQSINSSFICELECLKNVNDSYYDHVDFCNIEKLPFDLLKKWNSSYMHAMTWRWLPIGDSFVDFFSSRDTDSWLSHREIDSVNVWMNSNTLFHVMRGKNSDNAA